MRAENELSNDVIAQYNKGLKHIFATNPVVWSCVQLNNSSFYLLIISKLQILTTVKNTTGT